MNTNRLKTITESLKLKEARTTLSSGTISKELNGCEVQSLEYEGTVLIRNGKAFMDVEEIKTPKWQVLWDEYVASELADEY